mmetsp:Transcript_26619/g.34974  ORF Transcript_26619/g.34974 Transcript_26619/m.34974 type:complete len:684 (+) Transcript_26619:96-2147(+)
MGGGSSSLHRLRKILVIRAYNARGNGVTLEEHFAKFTEKDESGKKVLPVSAVKQALGLKPTDKSAVWLDDFMTTYFTGPVGSQNVLATLPLETFLDFLETGRPPPVPMPAPNPNMPPSGSRRKPPKAPSSNNTPDRYRMGSRRAEPKSAPPKSNYSSSAPRRRVVKRWDSDPNIRTYRHTPDRPELKARPFETMYPDVMRLQGFRFLSKSRALTPHKGTTVTLHGKDAYRKPWTSRPVWQKREIVLQERIVIYTTVDEEGNHQELVESEKSQTEVLHMECKDTGEFAHREKTDYEQMETFNKEVVMEERGNEEYVHLKSLEDEYEHLESNMPARHQQQQAPPPESPMPDAPPTNDPGASAEFASSPKPGKEGAPEELIDDSIPAAREAFNLNPAEKNYSHLVEEEMVGLDKIIEAKRGKSVIIPHEVMCEDIIVGLGWTTRNEDLDLDASCLFLDSEMNYQMAVNMANKEQQGATHLGDNMSGKGSGDDERIMLKLPQVPLDIAHLALTVNIYNVGRSFSEVLDARIRLVGPNDHVLLYSELDTSISTRGLLFAILSRRINDEWTFKIINEGVRGKSGTHPECLADIKSKLQAEQRRLFGEVEEEPKMPHPDDAKSQAAKEDAAFSPGKVEQDSHPTPIAINEPETDYGVVFPPTSPDIGKKGIETNDEKGTEKGWQPCQSID